ncbi:MAG: TetR/AcrR family transcriptional regulator [Spirochaetes bacterium]|nr:TetR/AcrR family transcriptional regulator [Spirochaetota bacterium]
MDKKKVIEEVALDIFIKKGYIKTPVRDIIDSSGFGTSTFYRYFKNKEDVLRSLLNDFLNQIQSQINEYYKQEKDFKKRFIETKKIVIDVFVKNKKLAFLYVKSVGLGSEIEKCINEFENTFIELSAKNIAFGIKGGVFRDVEPLPLAYSILGIIKFSIYQWIVVKNINKKQLYNIILSFHTSLGRGLFNES